MAENSPNEVEEDFPGGFDGTFERDKNKSWWKRQKRRFFRKKTVYKKFPILQWLPLYKLQDLVADLVAGLTVGVTVIPQGLAYGTVAALPPQYGLYSAYMGCFVYLLFGSTKAVTIGPTALMSLSTYDASVKLGANGAIILAFLTGCIVALLGLLNLGFLIDFISEPVIGGFTSAAALNIITTQIESLLGLDFHAEGVVETWVAVFEHIHETSTWDAVMGFASIAVLLLIRLLDFVKFGNETNPSMKQRVLRELCRITSAARNAIVIFVATVIAANLTTEDFQPFKITGNITSGLPPFQAPSFTINYNNDTYNFIEVCSILSSSIFMAPLVAVIEAVAIAKSVAKGQRVDASQEMLAIGTSNLLGSFVSSIPVSGSFSRTAVNAASGVRSPVGGIFTGILVLLAITVLTPYFYFIPKSCLAAVIICAVVFMIEVELVKHVWQSRRLDIIPLTVSFLCCLFIGTSEGILIGTVINLAMLLYAVARPRIIVRRMNTEGMDYLLIKPDRSIVFPAMDYFSTVVRKASTTHRGVPIVLDMSFVSLADFSTAYGFDHLTRSMLKRNGHQVIVSNIQERILKILRGIDTDFYVLVPGQSIASGVRDVISSDSTFFVLDNVDNVTTADSSRQDSFNSFMDNREN